MSCRGYIQAGRLCLVQLFRQEKGALSNLSKTFLCVTDQGCMLLVLHLLHLAQMMLVYVTPMKVNPKHLSFFDIPINGDGCVV